MACTSWVNNADTVAFLGFSVGTSVSEGTASKGVGEAVGVFGAGVEVVVGVEGKKAAADV